MVEKKYDINNLNFEHTCNSDNLSQVHVAIYLKFDDKASNSRTIDFYHDVDYCGYDQSTNVSLKTTPTKYKELLKSNYWSNKNEKW